MLNKSLHLLLLLIVSTLFKTALGLETDAKICWKVKLTDPTQFCYGMVSEKIEVELGIKKYFV